MHLLVSYSYCQKMPLPSHITLVQHYLYPVLTLLATKSLQNVNLLRCQWFMTKTNLGGEINFDFQQSCKLEKEKPHIF